MTAYLITAEQVEKAAEAIGLRINGAGWGHPAPNRVAYLDDARAAFRVAGLRIEGDET